MAVAQYICEAPVGNWWTATESGMWALRHKRCRTDGKFRAEWTYSKGRVAPHQ
jgi:hypothetical protein